MRLRKSNQAASLVLLSLISSCATVPAGSEKNEEATEIGRVQGSGAEQPLTDVPPWGYTDSGAKWELRLRNAPEGVCVALQVDGIEPTEVCGFDIPNTTEVGFGGGLKPGRGSFFLFGITSSRVHSISAEGVSSGDVTKARTLDLPGNSPGPPGLRAFFIERPPVDNVNALVAFDAKGGVVQRIALLGM